MKLTITNALLVLSLTGLTHAATVNIESGLDDNWTLDASAPSTLGNTFTAYVGVYTGGALTSTATFATINSSFNIVGSVAFATGGLSNGYAGYFSTGNLAYTDDAPVAGGNLISVWVTDGANLNALVTNSAEFPFDSDTVDSINLSVNTASAGDWTVVLGSYDAAATGNSYGGSYVLNNAIPEPATALLGAFGVLGLMRRRRA